MKKILLLLLIHTSFVAAVVDTIVMYCPVWGSDTFNEGYDRIDVAGLQSALAGMGITLVPFSETHYPGNVLTLASNEILLICDIMGIIDTLDLNGLEDKIYFMSFQPPTTYPDAYTNVAQNDFGSRLFLMCDNLIGRNGINKVYYPGITALPRPDLVSFSDKTTFMAMVNSDKDLLGFTGADLGTYMWKKYSLAAPISRDSYKKSFIQYFENFGLKLYGIGWNVEDYFCYQGTIGNTTSDKLAILNQAKFSVAFESTYMGGYITEKLFDAMWARSVPIYNDINGAVGAGIPADCFIDPDNFANFSDLKDFLVSMSEEDYNGYLTRINSFLSDPENYYWFSITKLVSTLNDMIVAANS